MGEIVGRYVLPHSPFLLPMVGTDCKDELRELLEAYDNVCNEIAASKPDIVIVLSPHGVCFGDHMYIMGKKRLITVVLGDDGKTRAKYGAYNDREFVNLLSEKASERGVSAGPFGLIDLLKANVAEGIDHGVGVPLYMIQQKHSDFKLIAVNIGNPKPHQSFAFGCAIADAVTASDHRVAIVASGELAKRHLGERDVCSIESLGYDGAITEIVKTGNALASSLINVDIQNRVRQNGLGVIQVLLGTFQGNAARGDTLYYGTHFGSGFLVASMHESIGKRIDVLNEYWKVMFDRTAKTIASESYLPRLARRAIRKYLSQYESGIDIKEIKIMPVAEGTPSEWTERKAGVSIEISRFERPRFKKLTLEPSHSCLAEEVIQNAVAAATDEFGYPLITTDELNRLTIEVGIVSNLTEFSIENKEAEIDLSKHGVLIQQDGGEGCCLPGKYSTVDDILGYAMEDAAFTRMKKCTYKKFEVDWHE